MTNNRDIKPFILSNISKYLANYAEPESQFLSANAQQLGVLKNRFDNVLIIPCYAESPKCIEQVFANFSRQSLLPTLVVAVVNAPTSAGAMELQSTVQHLQHLYTQLPNSQPLATSKHQPSSVPMTLGTWSANHAINLCIIDRCSNSALRINPKLGVGLARKLAADIALVFIHTGCVRQPWIYSTDADAVLPTDYFNSQPPKSAAALSLPFTHQSSDPELHRRSQLYEMHMRAYASRLTRAGSPYGYLSLGSALACSAEHYAQVRGFPKRNAGEDFYLLNKLAKTGAIVSPSSTPILLTARYSNRVPFGTGPALSNWPTAKQTFPTYPDQAFALLGELLNLFKHCSETQALGNEELFTQALTQLNEPIPTTLAALDPKNELGKLFAKNNSAKAKLKAAHDWFDALKTLRFVRFISKRFEPLELKLT